MINTLTVGREAEAISTSSYSVNKRLERLINSRFTTIWAQDAAVIDAVTSEKQQTKQQNPASMVAFAPCGTHLRYPGTKWAAMG